MFVETSRKGKVFLTDVSLLVSNHQPIHRKVHQLQRPAGDSLLNIYIWFNFPAVTFTLQDFYFEGADSDLLSNSVDEFRTTFIL